MITYKTIRKNMTLDMYDRKIVKCDCGGNGLDHSDDCPVGDEERRRMRG